MPVEAGVRSDVGRVRRQNEDNFIVGKRIWAVADGMGGQAAGAVASSIVIEQLENCDNTAILSPDDIIQAVTTINRAILSYGRVNEAAEGLGSTICGLARIQLAQAEHWAVFHIGDSRVYRYVDGHLTRQTVDHSEVEELVQAGQIDPDQARSHPKRNVLTRSLGQFPPPRPDILILPPIPGEVFVICSDGLTGEVSDAEIGAVLAKMSDPDDAAEQLLELALANGGCDNITIIVLRVTPSTDPQTIVSESAEDTIPRAELVVT
jgi:protein phosphatase